MKLSKIKKKLEDIPLKAIFGNGAILTICVDITDSGYSQICFGHDYMDIDEMAAYLKQLSGVVAEIKKELRK